MKLDLILSLTIGGLCIFSLGIVWYETIYQWTIQENMKFYVEQQCYKPNTFCESQNPLLTMSMLGICVVGALITSLCYQRFDFEQPFRHGVEQ